MKTNDADLTCRICGREAEAFVRHNDYPFVDGKTYDLMCHICFSVPKSWRYDEATDSWIRTYGILNTVQDMQEFGWDKHESEPSIKAVKRLMKDKKFLVEPLGGINQFEVLFIPVKELTLT